LFRTIAIEKKKPDTLRIELKLTPKQYYSRISALSKSNLVKKRWNALSYLFWQACLLCELTIEKGLDDLIKLKAIDSLEAYSGLSKDECDNIVNSLIQNQEIKTILKKLKQFSKIEHKLIPIVILLAYYSQTDAMNNKHIYKLYTIPTFYNPNILQQI
jgi:hypothetical protein